MPSPRTIGALVAGGFAGSVLRAALADRWVHDPSAWPWATFAVNAGGALLLGLVVAILRVRPDTSLYWRPLLGTGLCGGLTTFSTLQLEVVAMAEANALELAAGYLVATVAVGLAAVSVGLRIGQAVPARRTIGVAVDLERGRG